MDLELQQRILRRIEISPNGCWEWTGYRLPSGYGKMSYKGQRAKFVHRMSYLAFHESPADKDVCHHCDNPPCVNPKHLFLGTAKDNAIDMMKKKRHPFHLEAEKTNCRRGHPLCGYNLRINRTTGRRQCKECHRISHEAWLLKQDPEKIKRQQKERSARHYWKNKENINDSNNSPKQ